VSVRRVIRTTTLEKSDEYDQDDIAHTTPEARLAVVEQLRAAWFQDFVPERRLERVLECTDLHGNPISTGTRFLLIGGHAIAVHAEPRFTENLDVFVATTGDNTRRLRRALVEFGLALA
jgi:hypothetical protein